MAEVRGAAGTKLGQPIQLGHFLLALVIAVGGAVWAISGSLADVHETVQESRIETRDLIGGVRKDLRAEIGGLRGELSAEIAGLRGELRAEIAGLRTEIEAVREELRAEIAGLRSEVVGLGDDVADIRVRVAEITAPPGGTVQR